MVSPHDSLDQTNTYVYNLLKPDISPRYSHLYNPSFIKLISESCFNHGENIITYMSNGALGDLIHCLYVVKNNYIHTGQRGTVFLGPTFFTKNYVQTYNDIKDTIERQEYIYQLKLIGTNDIKHDQIINLDKFRHSPLLNRADWLMILTNLYNIPLLNMSWLRAEHSFKKQEKVLINRSTNRHIPNFPWKNIVSNLSCHFITQDINQYHHFPYKTQTILLDIKDFSNFVNEIGNCRLFIGNQSAPLAIAYALGKYCMGELHGTDTGQYMNLDKYNKFYWISSHSANLSEDLIKICSDHQS